jgi:hypothetical protein
MVNLSPDDLVVHMQAATTGTTIASTWGKQSRIASTANGLYLPQILFWRSCLPGMAGIFGRMADSGIG